MNRELIVDLVQRLPQGTVSRGWGWLARRRRPRVFVGLLKRGFVRATGIDMAEAAEPMGAYATLEDLFVRRLRAGARRIDPDPTAMVSPVDARVGACGTVTDGTLFQVKGRGYSLARLLDDAQEAERFEGGSYATLYLSPRDYHRIHAPVSGEVTRATLVPGALMPVFPEALNRVDELFARNERIISYIDSPDAGRVAVVKVGATLVGRMTVTYDESLRSNERDSRRRDVVYESPRLINKGAELGAFELGSTVVLVTESGRVSLEGVVEGTGIRMGERMGSVSARRSVKSRRSASGGRSRSGRR